MRLLALEVRLIQVGFVVFEGSSSLLDWGVGVRWFEARKQSPVAQPSNRFRALMSLHKPSVVVTRRIMYRLAKDREAFAAVMRLIRAECKHHKAALRILHAHRIRRYFASRRLETRRQIATHIAERFEEVSWKLPKEKKPYQSEARAMLVFDAAATGIAFFDEQAQQKT